MTLIPEPASHDAWEWGCECSRDSIGVRVRGYCRMHVINIRVGRGTVFAGTTPRSLERRVTGLDLEDVVHAQNRSGVQVPDAMWRACR